MKLREITPFAGKYVRIKWHEGFGDWPAFYVDKVGKNKVTLTGADDYDPYWMGPSKQPAYHDGDTFKVSASQIKRIGLDHFRPKKRS